MLYWIVEQLFNDVVDHYFFDLFKAQIAQIVFDAKVYYPELCFEKELLHVIIVLQI